MCVFPRPAFYSDEALPGAAAGATGVRLEEPQARKMLEAEEAETQGDGGE